MRTGILGGTFNPIHMGHINAALSAKKQLSLDEVLIMPSGDPPHKEVTGHITKNARFEMTKRAIAPYEKEGLHFSDFEYPFSGDTYSYIILHELKKQRPDDELWFIIGEDSLLTFQHWVKPDIIAKYVNLAVLPRKDDRTGLALSGQELSEKAREVSERFHTSVRIIESELFDVSSTFLRDELSKRRFGEGFSDLIIHNIPEGALSYIKERRLYEEIKLTSEKRHFDLEDARKQLKKALSKKRYQHSMRVADTAVSLAARYSYPINPARVAGLLHDCAKDIPEDDYFRILEKKQVPVSIAEKKSPYLLHAKVGAIIARDEFGITDPDVLSSIRTHTTGEPDMSLLQKIIFTADYIEPGRDKAARLDEIREMAFFDIDICVREILFDTLKYLEGSKSDIDPATRETYEYYRDLLGKH